MAFKEDPHGAPEFDVVGQVGAGHLGQPVLGEDQLARGRIAFVDRQHAQFDLPREFLPAGRNRTVQRLRQAVPEGLVDLRDQPFEQRRHAGEEVVDR